MPPKEEKSLMQWRKIVEIKTAAPFKDLYPVREGILGRGETLCPRFPFDPSYGHPSLSKRAPTSLRPCYYCLTRKKIPPLFCPYMQPATFSRLYSPFPINPEINDKKHMMS